MEVDTIRELGSIPIAAVAIFLMYKLACNHMNRLADAIDNLTDFLKRKQ